VLSVAFSADGKVLATASRDRTVKLWDTRTGELRRALFGHTDVVLSVAFSPTGGTLASAGADSAIRLWGPDDGKPLAVLRGHRWPVRALAFHPDGRHLATSGVANNRPVEVKTWDTTAAREVTVCPALGNGAEQLELSPDGRRVAALVRLQGLERSGWRVYDTASGKTAFAMPGVDELPAAVRFTADSARLITLRGGAEVTIDVRDAADGRKLSSFTVPQFDAAKKPFYFHATPALTAHGEWLAASDVAGRAIVLRDCATGAELRRFPLDVTADTVKLLFSPDRRRLAAVCDRRFVEKPVQWWTVNITVWDTATGQALLRDDPKDLRASSWRTRFSPDGAILALPCEEQRVRVWQVEQSTSFDLALDTECRGVRFSPDGSRLVTVQSVEHRPSVRVWDLVSRRELFALKDFADGAPSVDAGDDVAFSADGRRLFTSGDGTVKVWDAVQGELLLTQRPAFSPVLLSRDGTRLVAGGPQGTTLIWFAPSR
jgi:WD40 repeat protein